MSDHFATAEPDWRRILDAVNDCVWSADVDTVGLWHYRYISPAIERIAGRSAAHFVDGRDRWLAAIHPEDQPRVRACDEALPFGQRDARDAEYRYRLVRPDGSTRWVRDVVRVSPGTPLRLDGVLADVTDQQLAELALRANEDHLRRIVDTNPDAILLADPHQRVTLANPAAARLFGRRRVDLVGQTWEQLGIEEELIDPEKSVLRGQQYTVMRPDGTRARVLMTIASLKRPDGEFAGFVATFDDVTALANATEKLARSEARARVLLQQLPAVVWSIDRDQRFTSSQGRGLKDLDLAPDQVVNMTVAEYVGTTDPNHPALAACRQALAGLPTNFDSEQGGRGYTTYLEPLRDPTGEVTGAVGISLDVTRTRELELRLRAAGRLDALGKLAGGAAHDINNLLTALLGHLHRAETAIDESSPACAALAVCSQAASRAAEIARQLLGVVRSRGPTRDVTDLNAVAREVLALLAPALGTGVDVTAALAAGPLHVRAEPGQIHQILINLCVNAREAMAAGGRLMIATDRIADGSVVRLSVADTGVGMTAEVRARIFEPLFTTKEGGGGTGLGLASVLTIVGELGGRIDCDSTPGLGSRFEVDLPAANQSLPPPAGIPVAASTAGHESILLVEDEAQVRSFARQVLEDAGYIVYEAGDGQVAIDLLQHGLPLVKLAILDLTMPRLGGHAAFALLRQMRPGLKAIFTSGFADGSVNHSMPGAMGYLEKPYRLTDLLTTVRQALDAPADA